MNIVLWIIQILLAAAFGMAGFTKLSQPIEALSGMMPWVTAMPALVVRFIGAAEVAGALGLILPRATKIQPHQIFGNGQITFQMTHHLAGQVIEQIRVIVIGNIGVINQLAHEVTFQACF